MKEEHENMKKHNKALFSQIASNQESMILKGDDSEPQNMQHSITNY